MADFNPNILTLLNPVTNPSDDIKAGSANALSLLQNIQKKNLINSLANLDVNDPSSYAAAQNAYLRAGDVVGAQDAQKLAVSSAKNRAMYNYYTNGTPIRNIPTNTGAAGAGPPVPRIALQGLVPGSQASDGQPSAPSPAMAPQAAPSASGDTSPQITHDSIADDIEGVLAIPAGAARTAAAMNVAQKYITNHNVDETTAHNIVNNINNDGFVKKTVSDLRQAHQAAQAPQDVSGQAPADTTGQASADTVGQSAQAIPQANYASVKTPYGEQSAGTGMTREQALQTRTPDTQFALAAYSDPANGLDLVKTFNDNADRVLNPENKAYAAAYERNTTPQTVDVAKDFVDDQGRVHVAGSKYTIAPGEYNDFVTKHPGVIGEAAEAELTPATWVEMGADGKPVTRRGTDQDLIDAGKLGKVMDGSAQTSTAGAGANSDDVRSLLKSKIPELIPTSGQRSQADNKRVGGVPNSAHLGPNAQDYDLPPNQRTPDNYAHMAALINASGVPGINATAEPAGYRNGAYHNAHIHVQWTGAPSGGQSAPAQPQAQYTQDGVPVTAYRGAASPLGVSPIQQAQIEGAQTGARTAAAVPGLTKAAYDTNNANEFTQLSADARNSTVVIPKLTDQVNDAKRIKTLADKAILGAGAEKAQAISSLERTFGVKWDEADAGAQIAQHYGIQNDPGMPDISKSPASVIKYYESKQAAAAQVRINQINAAKEYSAGNNPISQQEFNQRYSNTRQAKMGIYDPASWDGVKTPDGHLYVQYARDKK